VSEEKLLLLRRLEDVQVKKTSELKRLHTALCFIRAFPDSDEHYRLAQDQLNRFADRIRHVDATERPKLCDTGIAGTLLHYAFSFDVARWLAKNAGGSLCIDWGDSEEPPELDELLVHLLHPAEADYFDSGQVTGREWIGMASSGSDYTDLEWLMAQMHDSRLAEFWAQLYDSANLWLTWDLARTRFSKSLNTFPISTVVPRQSGMRSLSGAAVKEIIRPVESVLHLDGREGKQLLDVAMASLATRHRETFHFNHANPNEVYLVDVGEGVSIAVTGLHQRHRYPLEATMGYLILSNGVPIGYGGSSILFRQINTGVNIFDEYRGSEAAFLWVQVMRVFHELAGCTRFIANPYQFGADNDEALKSGAFWFYYRLGYRPVLADVRNLAMKEFSKIRKDHNYRSDIKTLRHLASCDMHLLLPGAKGSELFDERWLETSAMLATKNLGEATAGTRRAAIKQVTTRLAKGIGIRSLDKWSAAERRGLENIAPIVAAVAPSDWSSDEKRSLRALLRAKGGDSEAHYAQLLGRHAKLLAALRKACRAADPVVE
jgi:hypothetical protein